MENEKKKNQIIENGNNEKGIVSISQTKLIADADLVLRLRSMQILSFLEYYFIRNSAATQFTVRVHPIIIIM